jgi:cupin fold WbuC family metalloprotein
VSLSTISLLAPDPAKLVEDPKARTRAFFCIRRPVRIDAALLAELRQLGEDGNVRVCLHDGPAADHHDMVILEHPGRYYRPHHHDGKGECFHIMAGAMAVFVFEADGRVAEAVRLEAGDIYRIGAGQIHAVMPLSDPVIYHENKPGPFSGPGDSIYPDWAPDGADEGAAAAYAAALARHLRG